MGCKIFKNIAHYHCELAQNLLNTQANQKEVIKLLELALKYDAKCLHANLIKETGRYRRKNGKKQSLSIKR